MSKLDRTEAQQALPPREPLPSEAMRSGMYSPSLITSSAERLW